MTTAVFNESELKTALKRKCMEIEIIGGYADTVMSKYGSYLTGRPPSPMLAVCGLPNLGMLSWQSALLYYKIERYQEGETLKIKRVASRWWT